MYTSWSVTALEVPNATKWNILGSNDSSFNDGTGIADDSILARHMGINYSTTEQDTGKKWIDGKTIYSRVVTGVTMTIGATVNNAHGISIDTPISFFGISDGSSTTFPTYFSPTTFIQGRLNDTNITTVLGSGVGSTTAKCFITYTKK